jgi:hypothetical protein
MVNNRECGLDEGQMNDPIGRQAAEVGVSRTAAEVVVAFAVGPSYDRSRAERASSFSGTRASRFAISAPGQAVRADGGATRALLYTFAPEQVGRSAAGGVAGAIPGHARTV